MNCSSIVEANKDCGQFMGKAMEEGSLWRATAQEHVETSPLAGDETADLVVIGGGYTGCSAALHAALKGMSVRLLEAETIGHGGSGRNVGLVNAGLWTPPEGIAEILGEEAGARLSTVLASAPDLVFSLIDRHAIECESIRSGTLHCAHSPAGLNDLRERYRQLSAQGAPVKLLSAQETAQRTGSDQFHGALHDARAGTIQPLAYCRGLARAAQTAGAHLHEQSRVASVSSDGNSWRVETKQGVVTAKHLLLATNAYFDGLKGIAPPQSIPLCFFQMATAPLGHNVRHKILQGGEGGWDTAAVMSSFRKDRAGRVIIGAMGSLDAFGGVLHRGWARRKLRALFPEAGDQPFEHAWFGKIAMTGDHLPKILRIGPNGYAVFGYSGRGIGPGTVFGRAVAEAFTGAGEDAFPVEARDAHTERFTGLKRRFYALGATLAHAIGR